jgi:hypothetical protein
MFSKRSFETIFAKPAQTLIQKRSKYIFIQFLDDFNRDCSNKKQLLKRFHMTFF